MSTIFILASPIVRIQFPLSSGTVDIYTELPAVPAPSSSSILATIINSAGVAVFETEPDFVSNGGGVVSVEYVVTVYISPDLFVFFRPRIYFKIVSCFWF